MKKNSLFSLFMRRFIKSFLVIIMLLGIGYGSYRISLLYYQTVKPPREAQSNDLVDKIVNNVKVDDISKNVIYRVNAKTGKITGIVLEVFNTYTYNLDYITIPVETQYTITNETYQKLCAVNSGSPQIIKLSDLNKYFDVKNRYAYGEIILEDMLSIDLNYYTVMNEKNFDSIFENKQGVVVLSDDFLYSVSSIKEKEQLEEKITTLYKKMNSNLSANNKLKYVNSYMNISPDFIYYHSLYGMYDGNIFSIDKKKSADLIQGIIFNEGYTTTQQDIMSSSQQNSKEKNIEILNGSNITGLAAAYKDKLIKDGYTINHIGNYSASTISQTIIYVEDDHLGSDLLSYFNDASIQVKELSGDTQIQIILGTADRIN